MSILFSTHPFETLFALPLGLLYGWYILALAGVFYPAPVLFFFLLIGLASIFLLSKKPAYCNIPSLLLAVFLVFFAVLALTTHPIEIVGEGRDQGTFSNNALLLNASHGLPFTIPEAKPFFELYGAGKALNFPGLAYTNTGTLVPEFPLGYSVWLAGFVSIFGLTGFALANALLYLLSGMLCYTLLKRVVPIFWSFLATLVVMGGFLPLWFLSFTLSENLALFLFLLTTESVMRFQITKDRVTLLLAFASAFALALTRIEGWAIFVLVLILLTLKQPKRAWFKKYIFEKYWGILWIGAAGILGAWTVWINLSYYKAIAKALLKNVSQNSAMSSVSSEVFPLYSVLWEYGLLLPLVGGLIGGLYFWNTKRTHLLVPFFLALPTLPYLLLPHITLDAPWMLRRFLFSLYPALFISALWLASFLISRSKSKRSGITWLVLLGLIIGLQIPAMKQFTNTYYSTPLLPQVEALATHFSSEDLLLVDREATGDNFMMPARVLSLVFNRPAVYFFNPADLSKLDFRGYNRVLLLVPTEKIPFYEEAFALPLETIHEATFFNDHSFRTLNLENNVLPQKNIVRVPVSLVVIPYAR